MQRTIPTIIMALRGSLNTNVDISVASTMPPAPQAAYAKLSSIPWRALESRKKQNA